MPEDEEQRLEENAYIMEYFNRLNNLKNKKETENYDNKDIFDLIKENTYPNAKGYFFFYYFHK